MLSPSTIKNQLLNIISYTNENKHLFVNNPQADMSRQRKCPFESLIGWTLNLSSHCMNKIIKDLKTSDLFLNFKIPLGYVTGFPVLKIKNDSLCVIIPFMKYQTTGEVDKTLVFPIRYGITLELPTLNLVSFENYEYEEVFRKIDFEKPVGYFRHDAIKKYNRTQYKELKDELMQLYDKVINALLDNGDYTQDDETRMRELLQLLVEPSLMLMYRAIDIDFYDKYLSKR